MLDNTGSAVYAGARLDRMPICGFHWKIFWLIGAGMFLDAFEIYLAGGVLGALVKSGFSTMALNAQFISFTFFGMVVGAWLAGILGDRFGRRFSYQVNLALFGIASIAAAFAPNMTVLIGLRFIMGIGLGAEIVVGYATLTEFVPPKTRGLWVTMLAVVTNSALFASAFIGRWIIPNYGWNYMFLMVGIAALVIWFARKAMPESPRWLESKGRFAEADAILQRIETQAARKGPLPAFDSRPVIPEPNVGVGVLFSHDVIRRTLIGITIHVTTGIVLYGFIVWLPTFLVKQGFSVVSSLTFTTVMSLGGPVGALIGMGVADRFGRRPVVVVFSCLAALFGVLYANVADPSSLMAIGFCLVTSVYVLVAVGFCLQVPEMFPTAYRLRGTGLCGTMGRLASASVQGLTVAAFAWGGVTAVLGIMIGLLLTQAFIVGVFGIETRQRTLEELAPA